MLKQSISIIALTFSLGAVSLQAEPNAITREFRPLMAKKIVLEPAARAPQIDEVGSVQSQAWTHFDSSEWDKAIDKFLTALEKDPTSKAAAEGLAMSLYRSGDYASAYRLGSELSEVMPEIRTVVSETVVADVRSMVGEGELDKAREFLANFPTSDRFYTTAHGLLADANAISIGLGSESEEVTTPEEKGIAKN